MNKHTDPLENESVRHELIKGVHACPMYDLEALADEAGVNIHYAMAWLGAYYHPIPAMLQ